MDRCWPTRRGPHARSREHGRAGARPRTPTGTPAGTREAHPHQSPWDPPRAWTAARLYARHEPGLALRRFERLVAALRAGVDQPGLCQELRRLQAEPAEAR